MQAQSDFTPSFSPNGKQVAFYRYIDKVPELMIINKDGSGLKTVTQRTGLWSIGPSWSENGQKLHFSQGEGMATMDFSTIDLKSGKVTRVKKDQMQFTLAPRNGQLYWASKTADGFEFFQAKSESLAHARRIEVDQFKNYWVTPIDNRQMIVVSKDEGNKGVFLVRDGKYQKIIDHPQVQNISLSNDKKWLLFESKIEDNSDIYMSKIDGSGLKRLTSNEAPDFMPGFSPDGNSMVFSSARSGAFCLYTMDLHSKKIVQLTGAH